ncbi:MAG: DUF1206 domain-containing protein [Planctomycetota bacterium]|jgi:hypothetical protein
MGQREKKRIKAEAKAEKKRIKAQAKVEAARASRGDAPPTPVSAAPPGDSLGVRFADKVRGILYLLLGGSILLAIVLGQRNVVVGLDDLLDSLFLATAGKIVLGLIGVALAIYGLKKVGIVR